MRMQVSADSDRILVELTGVAGRQQSVLRALAAVREPAACNPALATAEVSVRASGQNMRISLRAGAGGPIEPDSLYRYLRDALLGAGRTGDRPALAVPASTA